jgi:hypothetical protein
LKGKVDSNKKRWRQVPRLQHDLSILYEHAISLTMTVSFVSRTIIVKHGSREWGHGSREVKGGDDESDERSHGRHLCSLGNTHR